MLNLPSWNELHPIVIHFPIALLLVAPLFLLMGAFLRSERGRSFAFAALILMVIGTAGAWMAVATGRANAEVTVRSGELRGSVERHEDLAETTRNVFTVLTLLYAVIVLWPVVQGDVRRVWTTVIPLVFLVFYAAGAILLARTAHEGGRLVHELGSSAPAVTAASARPLLGELHCGRRRAGFLAPALPQVRSRE